MNAIILGLLCSLSISISAWTEGEKLILPQIQKAYQYACHDEEELFQETLAELIGGKSASYDAQALITFGNKEFDKNVERLLNDPPPAGEDSSHTERLNFAHALIFSRSPNVDLIGRLIDFSGRSASIEANRIFLKSHLAALKKDWRESLNLLSEAADKAPILSVGLVAAFFNLDGRDNFQLSIAERARGIFERKLNQSVNPGLTKAAISYLESGANPDAWTRHDVLAQAHKNCPGDEVIAELYADELVRERKLHEAKAILNRIVENRKFPSAYSEFLLAQVDQGMGNKETALRTYEKLIEPGNLYLSDYDKEAARGLLRDLKATEKSNIVVYLILVSVALVAVLIGIAIVRRTSSR